MVSEERKILENMCDEMRSSRKITRTQWERLRSVFEEKFDKAWHLLEQRRVKHYVFFDSGRTAWIVVGKESEYQILPNSGYCDCNDFYFRVVNGKTGICYHLIAQKIAEALNFYDEIKESDEVYQQLMEEWRYLSTQQAVD